MTEKVIVVTAAAPPLTETVCVILPTYAELRKKVYLQKKQASARLGTAYSMV